MSEKSQPEFGDNSEESPTRFGDLEPAAYITGDGTVEGGALELHWPDEIEGRTYQSLPEPVFTAEQMIEDVEKDIAEFEDAIEDAEPGQDMLELKAGRRALLERKRRIEEFTQGEPSE